MKDIVEFIVKQFVTNPDAVEVIEENQDGYLNIKLKVDPADMGLTIGKSGQTIKAIRRLLTIKAIAENVRVNLELVDSGNRPEAQDKSEQAESETEESKTEESESEEAAVEPEKKSDSEEKPQEDAS